MNIFLTGGTGYVGSALLPQLLAAGHRVTALVRNDERASAIRAAGATPVIGDLTDTDLLAEAASEADAVLHLASPGNETNPAVDAGVVEAFLLALHGSGKTYVHTSGAWTHGNGSDLTETTPFAPPALTAWRLALDSRVLDAASDGVRSIVIAPGIVYGHGAGLVNVILQGPRRDDGTLLVPGSGEQHWTTIHVDDLAAFYVAALENAAPGSYYLAVSGDNPTVREIALTAAERVEAEPTEQSEARLGALLGALALDQQASGDKARNELGWRPERPSLLQELRS
jgi:nucleoside-diphosphate-sugar epimerase